MQEALIKEKEAKNRVQDAFDEARAQWAAREEELKRQLSLYEQGVRREIERETLKSTKVVKKQRQRLRDVLWSKKAYSRKEAQHRDPPTKVPSAPHTRPHTPLRPHDTQAYFVSTM